MHYVLVAYAIAVIARKGFTAQFQQYSLIFHIL